MANLSDTGADQARQWARTGVLAAFALVLSYIETFLPLPIPLPGAKLGLANIPILMAFQLVGARSALAIAVIKVLVSGLLFGSPIMIPYSAGGTLLAWTAMAALVRVPGLSLVLVSVVASILHVAGQLAVATVMLGSPYVWYTFPVLQLVACFTGAVTGWMALRLVAVLQSGAAAPLPVSGPGDSAAVAGRRQDGIDSPLGRWAAAVDGRALVLGFIAYIVAVLCLGSPIALAIALAGALAAAVLARVGLREALMAAVPLATILVVTAIAQVLYDQQGPVLLAWGPLMVTQGAVEAIITMMARLACIMAASIAFVRAVPFERVTQALLRLLGPLRRLGVRVDAFALALDMAVRFIPVLVADFEGLRDQARQQDARFGTGGLIRRARQYLGLMGPLALQAFAYADTQAERIAADGAGEVPVRPRCAA